MKAILHSVLSTLALCSCVLLLTGGGDDPLAGGRDSICPGDLDHDGAVGIFDLELMLDAFGHAPGHPADLSGDGNVTMTDVNLLAATWGPCGATPGAAAPSPGGPLSLGGDPDCPADLNGDGVVNQADLDQLIAAWGPCVSAAGEGVTFFTNELAFTAALAGAGKLLAGTEDFEEAVVDPGACLGINDPLDSTTDNGVFSPGDIIADFQFQSNLDAPGLEGPNPRGENGFVACGPGAFNAANKAVAPNFFVDSCDVIAQAPIYTAIGITVAPGLASSSMEVRVFDLKGSLVGTTTIAAIPAGSFVGILMSGANPVGRVNIWNTSTTNPGTEYIYDMKVYTGGGTPCPEDLNNDGIVNFLDLQLLLTAFGLCSDEGSAVGPMSTDGTEIEITEPGLYLLAVCVTPRDPANPDGGIFLFEDPLEVSGPDGSSGPNELITAWDGSPPNGGATPGDYVIMLSGVSFSTPPPAGTSTTGPEFVEDEVDAGALPGDAKETTGTGPLTSIAGTLAGIVAGAGGGDFEDMYLVQIDDPALFSATTATSFGGSTEFDSRLFLFAVNGDGLLGNENVSTGAVEMPLDFRPSFCPNDFNREGHGSLGALILGTTEYDASMIDPATITILRADGVGTAAAPTESGGEGPQFELQDYSSPFTGDPCDCDVLPGDGLLDLAMKFRTDDIVPALQLDSLPFGDVVELVVSGSFFDGTPFISSDCIRLVPPGTPPGYLSLRENPGDNFIEIWPPDNQLDTGGWGQFERDWPIGTIITLTAPTMHQGRPLVGWRWNGMPLRKYDESGAPGESSTVSVLLMFAEQTVEPIYATPSGPGDGNGP